MEIVTIKIDENLLNEIDTKLSKHNYSTRTEFIREAIRDKLKAIKNEDLILKMYGASKRKTTDEQLHKVREKIARELEREFK